MSYNKFLAKLASDHRKPDGLFVITPKMGPSFVETLPVRKFHGIGPATAKKMARLPIETGLDLKSQTEGFLQHHFGKAGSYYYWAARGIHDRPVRADRMRKSVGAENTFPVELFTYEAARDALREIVDKYGATARAPAFAAALLRSRSSSPTFRSLRAAAPVRCKSGRGASSNSSATRCSNLSFLSLGAFGSSDLHVFTRGTSGAA